MTVTLNLPVVPPVQPMLAKLARTIPDGDNWLFEPKWDGFRCIVFRDGDEIELVSRKLKPLNRYFPELIAPLLQSLPARCVVDGEIVIADHRGNGLDFDALLQRIHPAKSRVERLAAETPSCFVAFDVLAQDDRSLMDEPFIDRRSALVDLLTPNDVVRLTPASTDRETAQSWFGRFEGAGLDGIIAKPIDGVYEPGKRSLIKVKHQRTGVCAVPGYRIHKDGNGVGSLLLALHDDDGALRSVGVAAAFSVKRRAELLDELRPQTLEVVGGDSLEQHPWRDWIAWQDEQRRAAEAGEQRSAAERNAGGSRWSVGKDTSFVPLALTSDAGLVAEVTFGQLEGGRFRHGVSFVAWRPDRTPADCRYDQLDVAEPVDFHEFLDQA